MIVDLDVLKACGIDYESLKKTFSLKGKKATTGVQTIWSGIEDESRQGKLNGLRKLIASRIADGRSYNLTNHSIYKALDDAWDTPLRQITPTMLKNLIDSSLSDESKIDQIQAMGISVEDMLYEVPDPKSPGKSLRKIRPPALVPVTIQLVRSYVTIRWAKIMNDRRLVPFLKYEPAISDQINRTRCDVITQRVEAMSTQYGYYDVVKQATWRMLHYSECFQFPVEPWDQCYQIVGKDAAMYKGVNVDENGDEIEEGSKTKVAGKKVVMREGLRYHLPHPTRTFYDRAWFPSTFNSDSGAQFAGYWRILRYSEVLRNKEFYNLDTISFGDTSWYEKNAAFFANVYQCALKFPPPLEDSSGKSKFDSEAFIGKGFYTSDMRDNGCMLTELFMKLVPSEYGMGKYDYPVWFRFVVAGDDTIVYCAPLPYCPVIYYGYDAAEGRTMQASLSLEVLPYQDQFSNLMSQWLLSVKQNLFNLTLADTDVMEENDVKNMETFGQKFWAGINVIRFSMKKLFKQGGTSPRALYPEKLPQMDTQSISLAMRMILEILERVLVMSSQEVGQPASHEQTREEVRNIASNTSTRLQFTASAVDVARDAMKRQLYEGLMAYGDVNFYAQIAADPSITEKLLEENGFTVKTTEERNQKRIVHVKDRTAIQVMSFASSRDGDDRINDSQLAASMGTWMVELLNNPMMSQALGPEQGVKMANMVARLSGFPRDFKLINRGADMTPEENNKEIMQQVQQFVQQVVASQQKDTQDALKQIMDVNAQQTDQINVIAQQGQALGQQIQQLEATLQQPPQMQPQQRVIPMPGAMPSQVDPIAAAVPKVNPAVMA